MWTDAVLPRLAARGRRRRYRRADAAPVRASASRRWPSSWASRCSGPPTRSWPPTRATRPWTSASPPGPRPVGAPSGARRRGRGGGARDPGRVRLGARGRDLGPIARTRPSGAGAGRWRPPRRAPAARWSRCSAAWQRCAAPRSWPSRWSRAWTPASRRRAGAAEAERVRAEAGADVGLAIHAGSRGTDTPVIVAVVTPAGRHAESRLAFQRGRQGADRAAINGAAVLLADLRSASRG